jgi:TonB family protein
LAPWPRRRWWFLIGLVFSLQVGLIFLLSDKSLGHPRSPGAVPGFRLAPPAAAELLTLSDPTLFALPHLHGFSGSAWLRVPAQKFPAFDWTEEPRWLPLPLEQLGGAFARFMKTNAFGSGAAQAEDEAELTLPEMPPMPVLREQSTFQLAGGLAGRRLITPIELPSWQHTDILTNTVVRLVVDAAGQTISATLLKRSGYDEADRHALKQASGARFEALGRGGPRAATNYLPLFTWGEMIFEWHTLPLPPTNAAPATVAP